MIVLLYIILSVWIAEVCSSQAANSSFKNVQIVEARQNWTDYQITKAIRKCEEYAQYACQYQKSFDEKYCDKDPVLNGKDVPEGLLPHMAVVVIKKALRKKDSRCSGSLISEQYVMSAGHCTHPLDKEIKVKLGSVYRTNDGTGKWYDVESVYKHPNLVTAYFLNDVVLLKLSEKVHFNPHVIPICLNTKYKGDYERIIASGWGYTETGRPATRLKMAELQVKGEKLESECRRYINTLKYADVYKIQTICAGGIEQKCDTCKGDSGGPLQVPLESGCPNTYEQIGITSFGEGNCSLNTPQPYTGMYAKVEYFVPWIASVVWPDVPEYRENTSINFTEQLISN